MRGCQYLRLHRGSLRWAAQAWCSSLANYFFRRQPPERVRQLRRLAIAASATWVVVWASNFWLLPSVVTAVESEAAGGLLDGRLSLIGYDLSKDVLLPGET